MKSAAMKKKIAMLTASAVVLAGAGAIKAYAATYMSRTYNVYNYNTSTFSSTYQLSQEVRNLTSTASAYTIIPPDDRVTYENSGIVRLGNGYSGFVVGDHTIATRAYSVYSKTNSAMNARMAITLYDDEGNVSQTVYPDEAHIPALYKTCSTNDGYKYDYALLTVSEDLSSYEHFNLGVLTDSAANNSIIPVHVAGFDGTTLKTGSGRFQGFSDVHVTFNTDTTSGQFGGPVYLTTSYRTGSNSATTVNTVVAINTTQNPSDMYNQGTRITSEHIMFYKNNEYNTYE